MCLLYRFSCLAICVLLSVLNTARASSGGFGDFAGFDVKPDAFLQSKPTRRYGGSYHVPYSNTGKNYGNAGVKYGFKDGYGRASIIPYGGHSYGKKSSYQYGVIDEDKKNLQVPDSEEALQQRDGVVGDSEELPYVIPSRKRDGLLQDNRQQAYNYKLGYGYTESKNYGLKGVGTLNNRDVASDAGYEAGYDQSKQLAPKSYYQQN